ncbi:MAG: hypothetical protein ACYC7E_06910 [Armatimonadota bacterium]
MKTWLQFTTLVTVVALASVNSWAGEAKIILRDYLQQQWTNELLSYPISAPKGACDASSVTLTGPQGPLPVQLSEITYWPGTQSVKSAKLCFITSLAPLAADTYTVRYNNKPVAPNPNANDLKVIAGKDQVEITTRQFGARLLLGGQTFQRAIPSSNVPAPVFGMRLADGTWFGNSYLYGPAKIKAYSAVLTDSGPVYARVAVRYTYEDGNTLDVTLRIAAGDNTLRLETRVAKDQPKDGFNLVLNRNLPQLIFQVQDEIRKDRDCFMDPQKGYGTLAWADLPLNDYVAPKNQRAGLVTQLSPWEDWFGSFTQTRIRLRLENTTRELQIRSLDPGAWVEPLEIEEIFNPNADADPAKSQWLGWGAKLLPILKDTNGDVLLQVNAAQGVRKWTVSECRSMPGVASLMQWHNYKPEIAFPPETRPTIGVRLDEVKDFVLDWKGDAGTHPRLFMSRSDLEAQWKRGDADKALLEELLKNGSASAKDIYNSYLPPWTTDSALGAFLLTGSAEVAEKTQLVARLRQALNYDLCGMQFGYAGIPAPILYDGVIDNPWVPEAQRQVLRAQMAYYAYRLTDPAVWSAERGYCSGNQNMTVTWEISRGITACAIPTHPMAKTWYRKAERIMDYFLTHMIGPAGEWPESMGGHGRTSINMILAFAVASTNSGLHDYVNDPRVKNMVLWWGKMETPRDPRARGIKNRARPNLRYFPAMGRDCIGGPGGTCGVLARALRKSDPALASDLQWAWLEEGGEGHLSHLGGFSYIFCDKNLPSKQPNWTSEVFPYAGAVFRHGLGTADEHQVMLYSGDHFAAFYPNHAGSFPGIFAYGMPVAGSFSGSYEYQEEYLTCTVGLAHGLGTIEERSAIAGYVGTEKNANMWSWPKGQLARFGEHGGLANVSSFSTLPRQDYAAVDVARHYPRRMTLNWRTDLPEWPAVTAKGKPPVDWRRQTLFLKDDDPANATYLLIRDTIKGGQPTMWQMWNLSETLDTPEKVKDVAAVLANKPGATVLPPRALQGNRFTAIGQFGVDVEYFIASPTATPRYTLRWGAKKIDWANDLAVPEYQDLLHLQLPGDGTYYVAFFPRKRNAPAPVFSTLGGGTIIKVQGDFGRDYGFLSAQETSATSGDGVSFKGTAGSVQDRASGLVLSLGAKGEVRYRSITLAAEFPASLRVKEKALTVELPATLQPPAFELAKPFPGGTVTITAPGEWAPAKAQPGVKLEKTAAGWALTVPAGVRAVELISK